MKRALQVSLLVFLFLLIGHSVAQARTQTDKNPYWEGEITMQDGTVKKALVKVPRRISQNNLYIKENAKAKSKTIRRLSVKSITLNSPNGKTYVYDNVPYISKVNGKKVKMPILLLVHKSNNYAKIYYSSSAYIVNKESGMIDIVYIYTGYMDSAKFRYHIWKRDQGHANLFAVRGIETQIYLQRIPLYTTEVPSIMEQINNKELSIYPLENIIDLYLEGTKDM